VGVKEAFVPLTFLFTPLGIALIGGTEVVQKAKELGMNRLERN
jgi:hypothetical protein